MQISILSIKEFKFYKKFEDQNCYVIMSTSTSDKLTDVKKHNKLILHYDDITNGKNAFTAKHAKQIKRFIKRIKNTDKIYCLCDCGISRSSAIASALHLYYNSNDLIIWEDPRYTPNPLIYKTLTNALNINLPEAEINKKIQLNKLVLKNTIQGGLK